MPTCLIIDDEPLSREVLRKYIAEVPELKVLAECSSALEAISLLGKEKVDLIFLDISMPGLTGIAMARSLNDPPLIVFTTAYPQFAVEGFELNALDYLVKPFSFERFLKAVNRAMEKLGEGREEESQVRKIMVRSDKKLFAIDPSRLMYIEGQGDYIRLHLEDQRLVVHDTLKGFLEQLPQEDFMRVHKSWVVNLKHISYMEGNSLRIGEESIPVSPPYRDEVVTRFSGI